MSERPALSPCPQCLNAGGSQIPSHQAYLNWVWYYRCDECGYVWSIPKDAQESTQAPVPLRRKE